MKTITEAITCGLVLVKAQNANKKTSITTINKTIGLIRLANKLTNKSLPTAPKCAKL